MIPLSAKILLTIIGIASAIFSYLSKDKNYFVLSMISVGIYAMIRAYYLGSSGIFPIVIISISIINYAFGSPKIHM